MIGNLGSTPVLWKGMLPKTFEIYTDGSDDPKSGAGSWAFVILYQGLVVQESFGRAQKTDCNRMEFTAAIEALKVLHSDSNVTLFTDSRVMIEAITLKFAEWKANDWIKKSGSEIPNLDLFRQLDALNTIHQIHWQWVKAHSGNFYNERCDQLCLKARKPGESIDR